jgi:hypothetical protein
LDPEQAVVDMRHEIEVGTMSERKQNERTSAGQPLQRRDLAEIPLLPAIERPFHSLEHTFGSVARHAQNATNP